jgi:hypothetical protein
MDVSRTAGFRLDVAARWDNSASNPNNPDPARAVEFAKGPIPKC